MVTIKFVRMSEKEVKDLSKCRDCRHLHRYRVQFIKRNSFEGSDDVEVYDLERIRYRCLVSKAALMSLWEIVVVDCNQFEERKAV